MEVLLDNFHINSRTLGSVGCRVSSRAQTLEPRLIYLLISLLLCNVSQESKNTKINSLIKLFSFFAGQSTD